MNKMEYEEALTSLTNLEENVVPGDTYEAGRMKIVDELINEAEYMIDHIEDLKEDYEEAMAIYETTKEDADDDVEQYKEAYQSLDETIERFNDMTHLDMYQELADAHEDIVSHIEEWANSAEQNINESLEANDFANADHHYHRLKDLQEHFSALISEDLVDNFYEKIEQERERFVFVPENAVTWDASIVENDFGAIQIKGIREHEGTIEVITSFTGEYQSLTAKINLEPRMIHSGGESISGSTLETRMLPEETLVYYHFSDYDDIALDDVVRVDFHPAFIQEDPIQVIAEDLNEDDLYKVPGIESIQATHEPGWTLESNHFDLHIDEVIIENYQVTLTGMIEPNKDGVVQEVSTVYLPFSGERETIGLGIFGGLVEKDLYQGTEVEFNQTYPLNEPITEHDEYMNVLLFEQQVAIDVKNGELRELEKPSFIMDLYHSSSDTVVGFDSANQEELYNQSGDRVSIDSIMFTRARIENSYHLLQGFDTFTTTLQVHQDFSGKDYGSTEITFYSFDGEDKEELYATEIKEKHKAEKVEIDVSKVDILIIETSQTRGPEGLQKVILEDPKVE